MKQYDVFSMPSELVKDGKWDMEKLTASPIKGKHVGLGFGDIRDSFNAKSTKSRGEGYETQTIKAEKFGVFRLQKGKDDTDDKLTFGSIPSGPILTFQGLTSEHDKSALSHLIDFVETKDNSESAADKKVHMEFEDVAGQKNLYLTILKTKEGEYKPYFTVTLYII